MSSASIDADARIAALAEHDIDSVDGAGPLRRITDFAAKLCTAPIALVSLVEADRQRVLARTGLEASETPLPMAFCVEAMHARDIVVIGDARADAADAADPSFGFYAAAPLIADDGTPLGVLCVIDPTARDGLTELQRQGLALLAEQVMAVLRVSRLERAARFNAEHLEERLAISDQRFGVLADAMPQMVWSADANGRTDYHNARWYEFTARPIGASHGDGWLDIVHPDDRARAEAAWQTAADSGQPYQIEYRLRRHDGVYRWALGRALAHRDSQGRIIRWYGTCTDIHEQRQALEEREVIAQELSHRIKNIFSVISGLIGFAARARPEFAPIADDLRDRVTALGRAHDFVRPHSANSRPMAGQSTLTGLLAELFAAYQPAGNHRIIVTGDDIAIDDRSTTPLALLFHELATNAIKYGALSTPHGRVMISIAEDGAMVRIDWVETGGPALHSEPVPSGFGSRLIELSVVRQLGGQIDRRWAPAGVEVTATIPRSAFSRG